MSISGSWHSTDISDKTGAGTASTIAIDPNPGSVQTLVVAASAATNAMPALSTSRTNDLIIVDIELNTTLTVFEIGLISVTSPTLGTLSLHTYNGLTGAHDNNGTARFYAVASGLLTNEVITINISTETGSFLSAIAYAISDANTSSPFDSGGPIAHGSNSNNIDPVSITTVNPYTMILGTFREANPVSNATGDAGAGYTQIGATTNGYLLTEFLVVNAAGTYSVTQSGAAVGLANGCVVDAIVSLQQPTSSPSETGWTGYPQLEGTWASTGSDDTFANGTFIDGIASGSATNATSVTTGTLTTVQAKDMIFAVVFNAASNGGGSPYTPTGNESNSPSTISNSGPALTWVKRWSGEITNVEFGLTFYTGPYGYGEIWYAFAPSTFSGTITATLAGEADNVVITAFGVANAVGFDPNLSAPVVTMGLANPDASEHITTTSSGDLLLGFMMIAGNISKTTTSSPFNLPVVSQGLGSGDGSAAFIEVTALATGAAQTNLNQSFNTTGGLEPYVMVLDAVTGPLNGAWGSTEAKDRTGSGGVAISLDPNANSVVTLLTNGSAATNTFPGLSTSNTNDLIVVDIEINGGGFNASEISVTSPTLGTFTLHADDHTSSDAIFRFYAVASGLLSNEVLTIHLGSLERGGFMSAIAYAISNANTSSPFDSGGPVVGTSAGSGVDPLSITPVNAYTMIVGTYRESTVANTAGLNGSAYTQIGAITGGYLLTEYDVVFATGTYAVAQNGSATGNANGGIIDAILALYPGGWTGGVLGGSWHSTGAADAYAALGGLLGGSWHSTGAADLFGGAAHGLTGVLISVEYADGFDGAGNPWETPVIQIFGGLIEAQKQANNGNPAPHGMIPWRWTP